MYRNFFLTNIMKKLPILITSILLIGACSDSQETVQNSEPQPMVEYVWMKAGLSLIHI